MYYKHLIITGLYKAELSNTHGYKLLWHRVLRQCIPGASILLQKEDEQEEKSIFICWGRKSHARSGPGHGGTGWVEGAPQVFLCCCLQGPEALAQLNLAVAWTCALRLVLTLQLNKEMGLSSITGGELLPFSHLHDLWVLHRAISFSSGDNPPLLQVSLQAHLFLSAPPRGENLNAWLWAALAVLNGTQAVSLFRSFFAMPPGLMWGALWKVERPFKWPFLPADAHWTRQISACVREPDIAKGCMRKHWRQIRPNAFVMARALLINFVIW